MNISRLLCATTAAFALSCAESSGATTVDAEWNLSCPQGGDVGCGSLAPETCLGPVGQRAIVGARGETACTGEPIVAACEVIDRSNGDRVVFLEASVGDLFAFELRGATFDPGDGSMPESTCMITIVEDGLPYDAGVLGAVGACGTEPPSVAQPCQLSNISAVDGEVSFDVECDALLSSTTGNGFDVGAVGGGPTTIRFSNCMGF